MAEGSFFGCFDIGWKDPRGDVAAQCDYFRNCWWQHFETQDGYVACLISGFSEYESCTTDCMPDNSGAEEEASTTLAGCDEICENSYDDCRQACQDTFDSEAEGCEELETEAEIEACIASAQAEKASCQDMCNQPRLECHWPCYAQYNADIAGLDRTDLGCLAECCAEDSNHTAHCGVDDKMMEDDTLQDAQVSYWFCMMGCDPQQWFPTDDSSIVVDNECKQGCDVTLNTAQRDNDDARSKIEFDCSNEFNNEWLDCGYNYACIRQPQFDYTDALTDCYVAAWLSPDDDNFEQCSEDALEPFQDSQLQCCFNMWGYNHFDFEALNCKQERQQCEIDANAACPPPGTGEGEPCEHPDSDECHEANDAQTECLEPLIEACRSDWQNCIHSITPLKDNACGGLCSGVTLPIPEDVEDASSSGDSLSRSSIR